MSNDISVSGPRVSEEQAEKDLEEAMHFIESALQMMKDFAPSAAQAVAVSHLEGARSCVGDLWDLGRAKRGLGAPKGREVESY